MNEDKNERSELMKVWIDILTPKQVMLFGRLIKELEKRGDSTLVTTRAYKETNELLEFKGIDAKVAGKHGGGSLENKLSSSIDRMQSLQNIIKEEKPDVAVSLPSPEAARIAFGLRIKHVCINDIPEAEAQARLTVPLCSVLIAPKLIPIETWIKYGISKERVVQYDALDPVAWLKDFKPDEKVLNELGIDKDKLLITFRAEEAFASYLKKEVEDSVILPIVNSIMDKFKDSTFVVLPRYEEQFEFIEEKLNGTAIIPKKIVDTQSLLYYSNLFVGGGGTMTLESALLGTPTIACRPMKTMYEDYAIEKGLVRRITDAKKAAEIGSKILNNNGKYKEEQRKKADELMQEMEDPVEVILKTIDSFKK